MKKLPDDYYAPERRDEVKKRCRLSLAAYAYEFKSDSLMSDQEFDQLAKSINPKIDTYNDKLDKFFREEFSTDTGLWIHAHPELDKIAAIYYCLKNPGHFRIGSTVYKKWWKS